MVHEGGHAGSEEMCALAEKRIWNSKDICKYIYSLVNIDLEMFVIIGDKQLRPVYDWGWRQWGAIFSHYRKSLIYF